VRDADAGWKFEAAAPISKAAKRKSKRICIAATMDDGANHLGAGAIYEAIPPKIKMELEFEKCEPLSS
jgi:hypothetical protein